MGSAFSPDPMMALAGIVLIPVVIWFLKQRLTKNILLFGSLLFVVFARGTLEIIGISTTLTRLLIEGIIVILFIKGFLNGLYKPPIKLPGIIWLLLFFVVAVLSLIMNSFGVMNYILFVRDYGMLFLFFYGVVNISIKDYEVATLKKLTIYLFIAQVGANIIKYLVIQDIIEPYIGTMANLSGSLTVLFALFGASYTIAYYLITKKNIYIYWTLGFILFSSLGNKRAAIVFFPALFFSLMLINQWRVEGFNLRIVSRFALFSVLTICILYFSIRLMPTLNPDRKVWGAFDIEHAINYSERYVTTGAGAIETIGRARAPGYLLNLFYEDGMDTFWLGNGTGHLVKSSYNEAMQGVGDRTELTESLYGVGYGARTAFLQLFMQIGMLGVVLYLLVIRDIFKFGKRNILNKKGRNRVEILFYYGLWFVFLLDFFVYSTLMVGISSISIVMFFYLGVLPQTEFLKEKK